MGKIITVRVSQANLSHLRMVTTYTIDRQAIATRERTLRCSSGKEIDFQLAVDLADRLKGTIQWWDAQHQLPEMYL